MRAKKFELGDPITVWWADIWDTVEWSSPEKAEEKSCPVMKTRGYFLANQKKQNRYELVLAHTVENTLEICDRMYIPWGCIEKVEINGS
jgi:hypothetical protein